MFSSDWLSQIELLSACGDNTAKFWILMSTKTSIKRVGFFFSSSSAVDLHKHQLNRKNWVICVYFYITIDCYTTNKADASSCKDVCELIMKISLCTVT